MKNYKYLFTQVANENRIYQFEYNNVCSVIGRIRGDYSESNNKKYSVNHDFVINRIDLTRSHDCLSHIRLVFRSDDTEEMTAKNIETLNDWYKEESEGLDNLTIHFPQAKSD